MGKPRVLAERDEKSIIPVRYKIDYDLKALRGDLFGGVTASVVGLPVALAFGVASGLGAIAGLYGAIAVGFFASVFGGTKSQISGPTGPMAVAMAVIVTTHSNTLAEAFTVVVMAGVIQILLGVLRIGRFVSYTPYSVISGFMSGIGIIIMILQVLPFLGADTLTGGPRTAIRAMPDAIQALNYNSFVIAIVTLAVGVLWPRRLRRYLPPTLAAPHCRHPHRRPMADQYSGYRRSALRTPRISDPAIRRRSAGQRHSARSYPRAARLH